MRKEVLIIASLLVAVAATSAALDPVLAVESPDEKKIKVSREVRTREIEQKKQIEQQKKLTDTKEAAEVEIEIETETKIKKSTPSASPQPRLDQDEDETSTGSAIKRDKAGAQFYYDPVTKVVTLVTPSDRTHTLRLSAAAINNMFRLGYMKTKDGTLPQPSPSIIPSPTPVSSPSPTPSASPTSSPSASPRTSPSPSPTATDSATLVEESTIEQSVNEQGETVLTQTVTESKKLLGVIPVKVKVKIVINESTGIVEEETLSQVYKLLGFLLTD